MFTWAGAAAAEPAPAPNATATDTDRHHPQDCWRDREFEFDPGLLACIS